MYNRIEIHGFNALLILIMKHFYFFFNILNYNDR